MKLQEDMKLENEKIKHKKHCKYCGHTISFYAFEKDKKLCSHCKRFNYRNDNIEFKELFMKARKEINNAS